MTHYRFLEPLDVLFLRGNKLFGDPGSYGESLIPPWPSVAAGAIRSRMLADEGVDLARYARGEIVHPTLGTPDDPGSFAVTDFQLARRQGAQVQALHALPADLVVTLPGGGTVPEVKRSRPQRLAEGLCSSAPTTALPVLAEDQRAKSMGGYWLNPVGWQRYLAGAGLQASEHLVHARDLWKIDERVGIGLNAEHGRADDGKLFTVQAIALASGVGFLAAISGAVPPGDGMVRFGGDGRAAALQSVAGYAPGEPDYGAITRSGRCRVVLTSPGVFASGWTLPGVDEDQAWQLGGVRGRLVCASVPRAEIISGWDLARWQPKPAQRVAPTGAVYWIDQLQASPETLRALADSGLWFPADQTPARRAEGFNRFAFGEWK